MEPRSQVEVASQAKAQDEREWELADEELSRPPSKFCVGMSCRSCLSYLSFR